MILPDRFYIKRGGKATAKFSKGCYDAKIKMAKIYHRFFTSFSGMTLDLSPNKNCLYD